MTITVQFLFPFSGGDDFDSGPHPVTIPEGTQGAMLTIPIEDDNIYEGVERFTCRIIADSATGITAGAKDTANIQITDDDCEWCGPVCERVRGSE